MLATISTYKRRACWLHTCPTIQCKLWQERVVAASGASQGQANRIIKLKPAVQRWTMQSHERPPGADAPSSSLNSGIQLYAFVSGFLRKPACFPWASFCNVFSKRSRKTNVLRILPRVPSKRKSRIQLYDFGSRLICSGGSIKTRLDHDGKFNFMILFLGRFVGAENQNHKVEVAF